MRGDTGIPYYTTHKPLAVRIVEWCCGVTAVAFAAALLAYAMSGGAL